MADSLDGTPIDDHVGGLASAPVEDLEALRREGGRLFFAESFVAAVTSPKANIRRGRPIHPVTRGYYEEMDRSPNSNFGAYDRELHAIVFIASELPLNYERVTLHELGHARTVRGAYPTAFLRSDLLRHLPREIEVVLEPYAGDLSDRETIRELVLEVLAEGYAWITLGRADDLPTPLVYAVWDLLNGGTLPGSE